MNCKKCNNVGTLAIRKEYFFCDKCFISYVNHKFRACIGKNTRIKSKEKALICISGGSSSTILLDLVMSGVSLDSHKKLRISPVFLHVTGIKNQNIDEKTTNFLSEISKKYNIQNNDIHVVNFNDFKINDITSVNNENNLSQHNQVFSHNTARIDYVAKIKQRLYHEVAEKLKCNFIFTGETNTTLAKNLLANITMGRGSQVEHDIGFCDGRNSNVNLLRPMRDITSEELYHYKRITKLNSVTCYKTTDGNSLQEVISSFVKDLQNNSIATISAICKTADKLGTDNKRTQVCSICQSDLDTHGSNLSAIEAIKFSKRISSGDVPRDIKICSSTIENTNTNMFPHTHTNLCYCCSKTYSELNMS